MTSPHVSRRGFLSSLIGAVPVAQGGNSPAIPTRPEQAWVIVEQDWQHNDEFYVEDGERTHFQLYYAEAEAQEKSRQLCIEFYAREPPAEYLDVLESYLESGTYDPDDVTWDQLVAAGYQGPYRVQPLYLPHRKPPS